MPGGGGGWDDPQTLKISSERYATKDEVKVIENGYLVLFREHERDLVILKRRVVGLALGNLLLSLALLRVIWITT